MRSLALTPLLFAVPALAQNTTFLTGLAAFLTQNGLTTLANVTGALNSSQAGPAVLTQLSSGSPYLVFAPTDAACTSRPSPLFVFHMFKGLTASPCTRDSS